MKLLTGAILCGMSAVAATVDFTVSPDGTSIEAVLAKIREARQTGDNSPKRVAVRGCNRLNETLRLSAADSNISFEGESGASFFGGVEIGGWKVCADGIWRVELPEVKEGKWNFSTIYVNGERRSRPTIPAAGYYESVSNAFVVEGVSTGGFAFKPGELPAKLENISDVEVFALHNWATTRARIGELDAKNGLLRFASQRERERSSFDFVRRRYRLENVKEAFTEAGMWYLDRLSGILSYRPLPGETPAGANVVAPRLETLVRIDGTVGVKFENIVFAYQNLVTPETGRFAVQGGWNVPAAVEVAASKDVSFVRCGFTHTDGYAIDVAWNCEGTVVSDSMFCDLGAGGVRIGNFDRSKILELGGKRGTTVGNCRITDGGHVFPEGVGVFIGRSSYNTVVSNEIDHLRYSGVSVGWDWDDKRPSKAHHNEIAYNHIHDIGLGLLSDMGMIYLLGRAPGTTVHDNNLHDVSCFTYGGNGIYPDEGSSELKIWNNVVRNAKAKCYHQNYGEENEVFNNIFVDSKMMQWDCKPQKGSAVDSVNMHHNIFVWREGKFFERSWPFVLHMTAKEREGWMAETPVWQGFSSDSNILWRIDGKEPDFCGMPYSEWVEKSGHERGSFVGNPGFLCDVFSGDCSLASDSPAVRLGFKPVAPVDYTGRSYMISWQNNKESK